MKARYKTIVDKYAAALRAGTLSPGTRLPTHRRLATQEKISLATASRVYAELEAMGLVSGEAGRGMFARDTRLPVGHGIDQQAVAADMVDLTFNYPTLPEQTNALRQALKQLMTTGNLAAHLRYQPHAGRQTERDIIAAFFNRTHFSSPKPPPNQPEHPQPAHPPTAHPQPAHTLPNHRSSDCRKPTYRLPTYRLPAYRMQGENLLIVNGAQHGLAIAVMGLLHPGDVVAVDALTYPGFKALAALTHLELVAIPPTKKGPDLAALRTLCQQRTVRALYIMPTLHNPLGWVLSHRQRQDLAAIARQHDLLLIEDAAYASLITRAPPPLAAYAPERTVYVTGFSKNIATGLRVGAVHTPPAYKPALERAIRATTWNTPSLMVRLVCNLIEEGTVARFETLKRRDARARQKIAREILGAYGYQAHPNASFLWLPLPEGCRADRVAKALMDQSISVSTATPFCTGPQAPQALRIALSSLPPEALRTALITVRETIKMEEGW